LCQGVLWKRLQATQFYEAIELCQAVNVWCLVEPPVKKFFEILMVKSDGRKAAFDYFSKFFNLRLA
jgi:hypothetical protein